jgi:hypothetical protein
MTTYRIESVNAKVCRHRGSDPFEAAIAHIRAHITRRWQIGPEQLYLPGGIPSAYYRAYDQITSRSVREPFRITVDQH